MILFLLLLLPFQGFAESSCEKVANRLQEGDLVFLNIDRFLFREVAAASLSWTNHVGIAFQDRKKNWVVYESTFPFSKITPLCSYLKRSEPRYYAVRRLPNLTEAEVKRMRKEASDRLGILYHQGFDYESGRQFCSKFAYDIFLALGREEVGKLETFQELFSRAERAMDPEQFAATKHFFDQWYWIVGGIPMDRLTVTPASLLEDPDLVNVLDLSDFR